MYLYLLGRTGGGQTAAGGFFVFVLSTDYEHYLSLAIDSHGTNLE